MENEMSRKTRRSRCDSMLLEQFIEEVDDVRLPGLGLIHVPVVKGDFNGLPEKVQQFIAEHVSVI